MFSFADSKNSVEHPRDAGNYSDEIVLDNELYECEFKSMDNETQVTIVNGEETTLVAIDYLANKAYANGKLVATLIDSGFEKQDVYSLNSMYMARRSWEYLGHTDKQLKFEAGTAIAVIAVIVVAYTKQPLGRLKSALAAVIGVASSIAIFCSIREHMYRQEVGSLIRHKYELEYFSDRVWGKKEFTLTHYETL